MDVKRNYSKPLSLKKNSIWNILGSMIYALTQWGVLIAIANFGTPELVGIFSLGLALTAPIVLLMRFNLRVVVASDIKNEYQFSEYYSSRLVATAAFIIIIILVSILYSGNLYTSLVIILLGFAKAFESISDIFHGQIQKNERLDLVAKSKIIKGVISLGLFTLIIWITGSLLFATGGFMLSWFLILVTYDLKITKQFANVEFRFNRSQQLLLLKLAFPLGVAQLIASLNSNIPRYFIEYFHGVESLGFYAAIIYIITSGNKIIMAIGAAVIPRLSKFYQLNKIKEFIKIMLGLFIVVVVVGGVSLFVINSYGDAILVLIYTEEYQAYSEEFFLFMVLGIIIYASKFLETGLTATRKFKIQPYINIITLIIVTVLSYLFIPTFGIFGIGYSLLIAEGVQFLIRLTILGYLLQQKDVEV